MSCRIQRRDALKQSMDEACVASKDVQIISLVVCAVLAGCAGASMWEVSSGKASGNARFRVSRGSCGKSNESSSKIPYLPISSWPMLRKVLVRGNVNNKAISPSSSGWNSNRGVREECAVTKASRNHSQDGLQGPSLRQNGSWAAAGVLGSQVCANPVVGHC